MKKIIEIIIIISIFIAGSVIYLQQNYVSELKKQITDRDSTIAKYEARDSVYDNRLKQYTDTVEKYISPSFKLGDKNISVEDLLELANKSMRRADFLENRLNNLKDSAIHAISSISSNTKKIGQVLSAYEDSAFIYGNYVKLVERRYGLKFYHEKNGNTYKFLLKAERIDSALMLLPYFRDRLTYNAKKEYWEIETKRGLFRSKRK